ncbi:MAG: hypothetical protein HKN23_09020 [Verrucomicrobiales bacterium]|nr:hypothetical protein [Verrucomicrobiales bacterium]
MDRPERWQRRLTMSLAIVVMAIALVYAGSYVWFRMKAKSVAMSVSVPPVSNSNWYIYIAPEWADEFGHDWNSLYSPLRALDRSMTGKWVWFFHRTHGPK